MYFNIGKIRNLLSYNACSTIIHSLNRCRLDYCNSLLYNVSTHKTERLKNLESMRTHLDKIGKIDKIVKIAAYIKNKISKGIEIRF